MPVLEKAVADPAMIANVSGVWQDIRCLEFDA